MPEIQAFRGVRYNLAQVGSLSHCIAPPYDVVDSSLQDYLYSLSPYNFLQLELNRREPTDSDENAIYQRAARIYRSWRNEGVLQIEPDPAIYVYHQNFKVGDREYCRRGFMARVRLERFGEGKIYPHEQTHAKAKDDRLRLTRACQANLSQIFGLYPDSENEVQAILDEAVSNQQCLEATDHLGVCHRMWPVADARTISSVATLLSDVPMFVADGHHRYETACNYRDELSAQKQLPPDHPANFVLTQLVSMSDPGLIVLPTHRLIRSERSFSADELVTKLLPYFDIDMVGDRPEDAFEVWSQMESLAEQGVIAIYSAESRQWMLLTTKPSATCRMKELEPDKSEDWRGLGVAILHRLIFDDCLGIPESPKPIYVHRVEEVVDGLHGRLEGGYQHPFAALVMPASIDHIRLVSLHGERMPAKSTYFYPKLVSGLVVHPLS